MICSKCGFSLGDNSEACTSCGHVFEQNSVTQINQPAQDFAVQNGAETGVFSPDAPIIGEPSLYEEPAFAMPPAKRGHGLRNAMVAILAVLLVAGGAVGVALMFFPAKLNKLFISDADYLYRLEAKQISEIVNLFDFNDSKKQAYNTNFTISALMSGMEVKANGEGQIDEGKNYIDLVLNCSFGGQDYKVPLKYDGEYISIDLSAIDPSSEEVVFPLNSSSEILTKAEKEHFINNYFKKCLFNSIPKEKISYSSDALDGKNYNTCTVKIDEAVVKNILEALAKQVKNDQILQAIVERFDTTGQVSMMNVGNVISKAVEDLLVDFSMTEIFTVTVYYDNMEKIVSQKLSFEKEYAYYINTDEKFELAVTDNGQIQRITATKSKDGDATSGTIEAVANGKKIIDATYYYSSKEIKFEGKSYFESEVNQKLKFEYSRSDTKAKIFFDVTDKENQTIAKFDFSMDFTAIESMKKPIVDFSKAEQSSGFFNQIISEIFMRNYESTINDDFLDEMDDITIDEVDDIF